MTPCSPNFNHANQDYATEVPPYFKERVNWSIQSPKRAVLAVYIHTPWTVQPKIPPSGGPPPKPPGGPAASSGSTQGPAAQPSAAQPSAGQASENVTAGQTSGTAAPSGKDAPSSSSTHQANAALVKEPSASTAEVTPGGSQTDLRNASEKPHQNHFVNNLDK